MAALVGEQAEILMIGGGQKFLHIIVFRGMQGRDALAPALLLLVILQIGAFHITAPRKRDHHFLVRDQVFNVDAGKRFGKHLRASGRGKGFAYFAHFPLQLAAQHFRIVQDGFEKFDFLQKILVLGQQFFTLQAGKALQTHIQNSPGLHFGQGEFFHQTRRGLRPDWPKRG